MSSDNVYKKKNPVPKNFQGKGIITASSSSPKKKEINVIAQTETGAIGTGKRAINKTAESAKPEVKKVETVALFSTKNVYWPGIGRINRGYNIVKKSLSEQWLTRSHIREATPEEVAREFGL
jgi:hypothetical protein